MNPGNPQGITEDQDKTLLLEWHKPGIQRLNLSLDTAEGGGSGGDLLSQELFESDMRLKQDISGLENPLEGLLCLGGTASSAQMIPLLAETIKAQHAVIEDLQQQVAEIRRQTSR